MVQLGERARSWARRVPRFKEEDWLREHWAHHCLDILFAQIIISQGLFQTPWRHLICMFTFASVEWRNWQVPADVFLRMWYALKDEKVLAIYMFTVKKLGCLESRMPLFEWSSVLPLERPIDCQAKPGFLVLVVEINWFQDCAHVSVAGLSTIMHVRTVNYGIFSIGRMLRSVWWLYPLQKTLDQIFQVFEASFQLTGCNWCWTIWNRGSGKQI